MKYTLLSGALLCAVFFAAASRGSGQDGGGHLARFEHEGGRQESPETAARLEKEAAALETETRAHPENAELNMKLGFVYTRLRRADDAQRAFENAARLDPKKASAHYMLGLIYEKKGMRDRAVEAWKACLENAADPRLRDTAVRHLHHLRAN